MSNRRDIYSPGTACQVHWNRGEMFIRVFNTNDASQRPRMVGGELFRKLLNTGRHYYRVQLIDTRSKDKGNSVNTHA